MSHNLVSRIVMWVSCAIIGAIFGAAGAISHAWVPFAGIPVGFIIAAIGVLALLVAVRLLTHDRAATFACGAGMLIMTMVISGVGPGGSVIVENSLLGNIWVYSVAALAVLVAAWPRFSATPVRTTAPAQSQP